MKNLVFMGLLFFASCNANTKPIKSNPSIDYQLVVSENSMSKDTLLIYIQQKIYDIFAQSLILKDNKMLLELAKNLEKLNQERKQNIITYWQSYLQFYASIHYLKMGDRKMAEKEIDKGIDFLKKMKHKNSEDFALLAMLQNFSIQFKGIKAMFISSDVKENAEQSIAIDSTNLRAFYVYGSSDFYTPEKYGGGKKTERYLLKAISLDAQKINNPYLPSWGKEEAYELLIKFYIKKEKWELAKKYYVQGIQEFPESYVLNQLAKNLVGK